MSIPLDRLYHYIESIAEEIRGDIVLIYRFFPHGSKKLEDLTLVQQHSDLTIITNPQVYCNDQEPLDYDFYQQYELDYNSELFDLLKKHSIGKISNNLQKTQNIYDCSILLHSEKRSQEVQKYQDNGFITSYYWSHAIIARDWFRYAEYVQQKKQVTKTFLVYNRAWSGTREYRLGFANRLIRYGLVDSTLMRVSPVDSALDKHYDLHTFTHPHWRPDIVIEKYFPLCEAESHYSADFDQADYENTDIEVVLETLFDDLRLHLTEKTLRPIAMGQPFILAGTYGSLKYLRDYGFKTFSDCWDESYDMMSDSIERMNKIVDVMSTIVSMQKDKRNEMLERARVIAEYNKQHFFSNKFKKLIDTELVDNLKKSLMLIEKQNTSQRWINNRKNLSKHNDIRSCLTKIMPREQLVTALTHARKYYIRSLSTD
jgi:hypothetical protein